MVFDFSDSLIWHLFAGTRGGPNRFILLMALKEKPQNANQLTTLTGLDYKTVIHHLEVLVKNDLVCVSREKKYGESYFLTSFAESKMGVFEKIRTRLDLGKR